MKKKKGNGVPVIGDSKCDRALTKKVFISLQLWDHFAILYKLFSLLENTLPCNPYR